MSGICYSKFLIDHMFILCLCGYIQVDKDTVLFTFEMKSVGFSCTVWLQEMTDTSPTGLPFLTDMYLSLASMCCSLIGQIHSANIY